MNRFEKETNRMKPNVKIMGAVFGILIVSLLILTNLFFKNQSSRDTSQMQYEQHQRAMQLQDEYHATLRKADALLASKVYEEAEKQYLKALTMAQGSSLEGVSRGALVRFYESVNAYNKALEQVEIILSKDIAEPGRTRYSQIKNRLIQKIQGVSPSLEPSEKNEQ
jgi:tetratricopeptide (TPR) repeat protein